MDPSTAKQVIEALANGVDPRTGEVLGPGSPIESAEVVRALHVALEAIDRRVRWQERNSALPANAGRPWNNKDDKTLNDLFDSGKPVAQIAKFFERTEGSIVARLVRLGKIPDRDSAVVANLHATAGR
jgi:hypothetical protein